MALRLLAATLSALTLAVAGAAARPTGAAPDAIRVGGPSAPGDAKVAVVVSSNDPVGAPFVVVDANGATVLTGELTEASGSPAPWAHATVADLSAVRAPGAYTVRVGALVSAPWLVEANAAAAPLELMLNFFAANSDGREPSPLHGPAHLNDATVASGKYEGRRIDMTGGWMDAGDMLHFTQTTGFTAAVLQAAARIHPAEAARLNAAADVGVRWLVKAHPYRDLFIAQVGDERDHERDFRKPESDDASGVAGIATRLAYPGISGDLAGKAAAALALAADRASGARRRALLTQAEQWYAAGKKAGRATPSLPGHFYVSSTWKDDMASGAAVLYRSTGKSSYLADAVAFLKASRTDRAFTWDDFAAFAAADLCGALGAPAAKDAAARNLGCDKLAAAASAAVDQAGRTPWETPGEFDWGQTAVNGGLGAMAALAAHAGLSREAAVVGTSARDWLLGRNPWGASFVVGFGASPAAHPHHWAEAFAPGEPRGAVVGGPAPRAIIADQHLTPPQGPFDTSDGSYEDNAADYVTSEPASDYTAASILLLAVLSGR